MDLKPRDYQIESVTALFDAWDRGLTAPAVVLPTGMGKTVIFSMLVSELLTRGKRAVVLVHRNELAKQTVKKIHGIDPALKVGIVKAERDEHGDQYDVVVASVQTLGRTNRLNRIDPSRFDIVIIDEAHHAAAPSYRAVRAHFGEALAAGFTATMARADGGLGEVWQEVVYTKDVLWGIVNGYLVNVKGRQVPVEGLDLSKIKKSRGDFQDKDLGDALFEAGAPMIAALGYWEHCKRLDGTLRPGILFAPSVASAQDFADAFTVSGIPAEVVTGDTPDEDRELIYKRFEVGETKVISSCMVLTEGFDAPWAEVAVIARPTQIASLYTQMIGRVLRPSKATGKTEALVLDIVGISTKHKLASLIDLLPKQDKPIVIKDDETITDAIDRTKAKINWLKGGELIGEAVDLFARSTSAWLTTKAGSWFIPTKLGYFFLAPDDRPEADPGSWLIGKTSDQYRLRGTVANRYPLDSADEILGTSWGWVRGGLDLELAMSVAEELATRLDASVSSRKSSWRRDKISESQKGLLTRLGIEWTEDTTRSAASDLLSTHYASQCIDRRKR